jgi:hypothetical protein
MADLAEKLSSLVQYQLPDFVRDNYETFQAFLIAYYQFTEQNTQVQYAIQNAESYKDIDDTIDTFVEYFLNQYAYDLPKSIFLDQQFKNALSANSIESKRAFAKRLMTYYGSKGSEAGINLLFKLLFDDTPSIYYPKDDIFKPSHGTWTKRKTIKVINNEGPSNYADALGGVVRGNTSFAFAVIDDIFQLGFTNEPVPNTIYEVQLEPNTTLGDFVVNEIVRFEVANTFTGNTEIIASGKTLGVISNITILNGGIGYSAGDVIQISTGNNSSFVGGVSRVNNIGSIQEIAVSSFGSLYDQETPTVVVNSTLKSYTGKYEVSGNIATVVLTDNTGVSISHGLQQGDQINVKFVTGMVGANGFANVNTVISSSKFTLSNSNVFYTSVGNLVLLPKSAIISSTVGAITSYGGQYLDKNGHLDDIKKIQDSNYYQEYSYVIRAAQSSQYWKDIVKQTLHPAGLKLFSEIFLSVQAEIDAVFAGPSTPIYQTLLRFLRILSSSALQPVSPVKEVKLSSTSRVARGLGRYRIGPTYKTIETFKFDYKNLRIYDVSNITLDYLANNYYEPILFCPPGEANITNTTTGISILV